MKRLSTSIGVALVALACLMPPPRDVMADATDTLIPQKCELELLHGGQSVQQVELELRVRRPHEAQKRTFVSQLDNSIQYFGLRPAVRLSPDDAPPSLVLSCHGASVEGIGQAAS